MFINHLIFKHYNYNGMEAEADLRTMAAAYNARQTLKKSAPIWIGLTAFSAYNVSRMGVLSVSGRVGAISGLAFGSIMTVASYAAYTRDLDFYMNRLAQSEKFKEEAEKYKEKVEKLQSKDKTTQ